MKKKIRVFFLLIIYQIIYYVNTHIGKNYIDFLFIKISVEIMPCF